MNKNINKPLNKKIKNTIGTIENKYFLSNDGSSNLQSVTSNTTILNVYSRLLTFQLLVRNKTLNGNFDTTIPKDVNIGDLIEFKFVLTNLTTTSLEPDSKVDFPANNIFEFVEAPKPTVGSIVGNSSMFSYNVTLTSGQTVSSTGTFKVIGGSTLRLLGKTNFQYNYNDKSNPVYMYSLVNFKINQDNRFSLLYSKNSDGSSVIGPNTSPVISLNVLSPNNVLKVELLVRNKTSNGDFNTQLDYINTGNLIEFKIILTNISTSTISNISASIGTFKNIIEFIEAPNPTIGTIEFQNINTTMGKLNWTSITSLAAGQSIYALSTFKAIDMSPLKILAKVNFPLENVTRYMCSSPATIRINTENKFSLIYSKVNDGSSSIGPNTSNTTFLNIGSSFFKIDLLARNKTLNGNFTTNLDNISPNNIIELKIILTNIHDSYSISNLQISINILKNILEYLEASTSDGGTISFQNVNFKMGNLTWNFNETLNPWQSASAICTFKVISGANLKLNAKLVYNARYLYSSFVNIKINQENKFSLLYSKVNDGSSSIGPTPSNNISLDVSPSILKVELLVRNKSLDENFGSNILGIKKGSLIEFKIILTNVDTINSISNISTFVEIPKNILEFLESTTPTVGETNFEPTNNSVMGKLNWINIPSLEPGQSVSALATFNSIEVAPLSLLAKTNGMIHDIKRYVYSSPTNVRINPENSFSLMYSTTNVLPFNAQVVNSNIIMLDVYPTVLKIELLVKNKSLNGNFVSHMPVVDTGSLIEFKIILTNVSTEYTLNNLYSYVHMPFNIFQFIEGSTNGGGNLNFNSSGLSWTGINPLTPWTSIYAIGTFKAINPTNNINYAAKVRIPMQSTNAYIYSLPINMKIIIPPTIKKEQKIYSAGGGFTEDSIDVVKGEIIQYKLTVSNPSNQIFYNIKITDVLDSNVTYIRDSITDGNGHLLPNSKFISPTESGTVSGKIEWTIDVLDFANGNNSIAICFRVTVN